MESFSLLQASPWAERVTVVESCCASAAKGHRTSSNVKIAFTLFIIVIRKLFLKDLFIPFVFLTAKV
jgi:hypothetical protein